MSKAKTSTIDVRGTAIPIFTDWLHNRNTVEFLAIWELAFNPHP